LITIIYQVLAFRTYLSLNRLLRLERSI